MKRIRTHWTSAILTALWDGAYDYRTLPTRVSILNEPRRSPEYTGNTYSQHFGVQWHTNATPETEEISDETRSEERFNECTHDYNKQEYLYPRIPVLLERVSSTNVTAKRLTAGVLSGCRDMMPVPEYDLNKLAEQAVAFLIPSVNEDLSVLNFAYELRELKSLDPRDALRRVKYGYTPLKLLRDRKTRNGFLKDTARRIAGAHLQAEFGILPFLRDVAGLHDELVGIQAKIKRLKEHAGRPIIRHYKRVLPYEPGKFWVRGHRELKQHPVNLPNLSGDPWVHFYWGANGQRESIFGVPSKAFYSKAWVQRPVYHATCRYRYTIPRFDTEWGEKLAFYTEALGIRIDPSIPWNAARLSFLVDWVVDVSGFLSSFARENYPLNPVILDFCHSLKWHSESYISVIEPQWKAGLVASEHLYQTDLPPAPQRNAAYEVYRETDSHYERWRATPSLFGLVSKRASLRKAALAGSLLISNARYMKKGRGQYLRLLPQSLRELQQIRRAKR